MDLKRRLFELIKERSLKVAPEPVFKLASGKLSRYYLDLKRVTLDPEGGFLVGNLMFELIKPFGVSAVGGLTLGADPIAYATALTSYQKGHPIKPFVVRKEPKDHGTGRLIEGNLEPGERVVVVEDVVTTASSALKAVRACRDQGLEVVAVCAVVDREEGGRENLKKEGLELYSLFKLSDFLTEGER
ncbi:MAG: orotate phosphoribosyltransferase [Aquificae bacterium]|nr:orotate phosphoribosyltransferase [Aquificota bacterium]